MGLNKRITKQKEWLGTCWSLVLFPSVRMVRRLVLKSSFLYGGKGRVVLFFYGTMTLFEMQFREFLSNTYLRLLGH